MGTSANGTVGVGRAYERVFLAIAIVVTVVWAMATLVQVAYPAHPVPQYANLVMMIVAGSFFGGAVVVGRRNNGERADDKADNRTGQVGSSPKRVRSRSIPEPKEEQES